MGGLGSSCVKITAWIDNKIPQKRNKLINTIKKFFFDFSSPMGRKAFWLSMVAQIVLATLIVVLGIFALFLLPWFYKMVVSAGVSLMIAMFLPFSATIIRRSKSAFGGYKAGVIALFLSAMLPCLLDWIFKGSKHEEIVDTAGYVISLVVVLVLGLFKGKGEVSCFGEVAHEWANPTKSSYKRKKLIH